MELRNILFSLIEHIEVHLRAVITNYFSLKYGNFGYKELNNYNKKNFQKSAIKELEREIKRNKKSPFIHNFEKNYEGGEIPFYAAIEVAILAHFLNCTRILRMKIRKRLPKNSRLTIFI